MKLKIKARTLSEWLFWFTIMLCVFAQGIVSFSGMGNTLKYFIDVGIIVVSFLTLTSKLKWSKWTKRILIFTVLFFGYVLIKYILNYQNILYFLWGARNNFRYYIFIMLCIIKLKEDDVEYYGKLFDFLYWINFIFCGVEFLAGYSGDNLGGIFGVKPGCNGYINMFMVISVTRIVINYLNRKVGSWYLILAIIAASFIGAVAELKFFFVEAAIIVILAVLTTNFTYRKLLIIFACIVTGLVGMWLLTKLFPDWDGVFTLDKLMELGSNEDGYTGKGDLNRLTAMQTISNRFLTNGYDQLFGLGLGNADRSTTMDFLTTEFYTKYKSLHYTWISTAFMYIECGIVGMVFFEGFFVFMIFQYRQIKKSNPECKVECQIAIILAVMCMVLTIYNSSIRDESGYMMYLFLALPYCKLNKKSKETKSNANIKIHF